MTPLQWRGLNELCAACDESLHYWPERGGWVRTWHLSGTRQDRSSTNMKALVSLGYAEGRKHGDYKQAQWVWRINDAGREALIKERPRL